MSVHAQLIPEPTPVARPVLQRACSCGEAAGVSGKCDGCGAAAQLGVQPKLTINPPNDRYEQEADRIADQVVSDRPPQHTGPQAVSPLVQRQSESEEEEEEIQTKSNSASTTNHGQSTAQSAADAVSSGGRPLALAERGFFEPRFGRDLSAVRVHDGARAGAAAHDINARAYTLGHHIAFAPGEFSPGTTGGRRLIAHELAHTLQQTGSVSRQVQRAVCSTAATCAAPIPGSPGEFSDREAAREARSRTRRKGMNPTRARRTGHAGHARQLETLLAAHDASRMSSIHGIFIDADLSRGTAAMIGDCSDWAADSLPATDADPDGFAGASKECMFVPGHLNRQALAFNSGRRRVGGSPASVWLTEALNTLIHETEHVRFDTTIEPGLPTPGSVATPTCTKAAVRHPLSEIVSIISEFPLNFDAAEAEARPRGPAHRRLEKFLNGAVASTSESFNGAMLAMGCKCDCDEVDSFVVQSVDAVTTAWTDPQKDRFRIGVKARMPGPVRPIWPDTPTP